VAAAHDNLRLKAVGADELSVVVKDVETDGLDASRCFRKNLFGRVLLLDRATLIRTAVCEYPFEELVQAIADDLQLWEPAFIEDRHRCLIGDGLLNGVLVDVGSKGSECASVLLVDRSPRKPKEHSIW